MGIINPWVPALRRSRWFGTFLNGVNAASLGLMAAVTFTLGREAIVDWLTIVLAVLAAISVFRLKTKLRLDCAGRGPSGVFIAVGLDPFPTPQRWVLTKMAKRK